MHGRGGRLAAGRVQRGELKTEQIDETTISDSLYTAGMPDPDLLIRTAGEMRVSNYLLWQISYAELWVTERYWPEFGVELLHEALRDYAKRERRFGALAPGSPVAAARCAGCRPDRRNILRVSRIIPMSRRFVTPMAFSAPNCFKLSTVKR